MGEVQSTKAKWEYNVCQSAVHFRIFDSILIKFSIKIGVHKNQFSFESIQRNVYIVLKKKFIYFRKVLSFKSYF